MRLAILFIFLVFSCKTLSAQDKKSKRDSIPKDSLILEDEKIMQDLREFAEKDNLLAKAVELLLTSQAEEKVKVKKYSDISYQQFQDKIIRNIRVYVMDVFGPSIEDPLDSAKSWLEKTGNYLHVKTQKWLVRNQLLFKENDKVNPFRLSESERLLRSRDYLTDARIRILSTEHPDSVDVSVIVEDVWSLEPTGSFSNASSWKIGFEDQNFIGTGADLKFGLIRDDPYHIDWEGAFVAENFLGKNIRGTVYKERFNQDLYYGFGINRQFFSPVVHWAGGLNLERQDIYRNYLINDTTQLLNSSFNQNEVWLGYATDFQKITHNNKLQNEYVVAGSIQQRNYIKREQEYARDFFFNRKLYLGSFGYSYRRYYKDRFVLEMGRTEDIPTGTIISFLAGYEQGEFRNRTYYGLQAGYSTFHHERGYFFAGVSSGAFRGNHQWEEGVVSARFLYFTPLSGLGIYKMRHFIFNRLAYVNDPFKYQHLLEINRDLGIRGFRTARQAGNKKWVLNYEVNLYPPYKFFGFNLAFIAFADFAFLAEKDNSFLQSNFFHGYGLGIRFRNNNLIFRSIQVLFGIYPNASKYDSSLIGLFLQERDYYQFSHFRYPKPDIIRY